MCQGALESKKTGMGLLAARVRETSWRWIPWLVGRSSTSPKGRIRSGRAIKTSGCVEGRCCDNNVHAEQKDELGSGWTLKDSASGRSCTQSWENRSSQSRVNVQHWRVSLKGYGLAKTREEDLLLSGSFPKWGVTKISKVPAGEGEKVS